MVKSFHLLLNAIAIASDERELRQRFMDIAGEIFGARAWAIYLLDEHLQPVSRDVIGIADTLLDNYEKLSRGVDPVMHAVLERHAPAHEQLILTPEEWKQTPIYQNVCSHYGHEHVMVGPLVGKGRIIGTLNFARGKHTPPFNTDDLINLSVLCAHISACLAALRATPGKQESPLVARLTSRELQIAELVAQGLNNAEIGAELWITQNSVKQALKRMFRKLNVSARAELVGHLGGIVSAETREAVAGKL